MKYFEEKEFIISTIKEAIKLKDTIKISPVHKGDFDFVTELDKEIELKISNEIHNKYPNDSIYGEEFSHDKIGLRTWVIDPIDGTCNMARGIPIYGTQVALVDNNEIVLSVIYDINFNDTYYAIKGYGSYKNDIRIYVKSDTKINDALISFGDFTHRSKEYSDLQLKIYDEIRFKVQKIKMQGSASIEFSNLSSGKTDAYIIFTDNLWDLLPGILLSSEAGAVVRNAKGEGYKFGDFGIIATSNKEIYNTIFESIEK